MPSLAKTPKHAAKAPRGASREHLQALTRGLRAVAYLNRVGVCTNGAMAKRLGLKYSTAHRMLMVLTDLGLAQHDPICHQFALSRGVRQLAAGFHDLPFIDQVIQPRMRDWTRRFGPPLLLVTSSPDGLLVRAATDGQRSPATERYVAGMVLPLRNSSEIAAIDAFRTPASDNAAARGVRRRGFAKRVLQQQDEIHISAPLNLTADTVAALSIRCSRSVIGENDSGQRWADALVEFAAQLLAARA